MPRYDPILMGQCHSLPMPCIAAGVNFALLSYFQVKGISEKKKKNTQGSPATGHVSFCVVYHKY